MHDKDVENVTMYVDEDGQLVIKIDPTKRIGVSATGKSNLIATTRGAVSLDPPFDKLRLNLNLYTKTGSD